MNARLIGLMRTSEFDQKLAIGIPLMIGNFATIEVG
jgi:hypothetical protein